MKTITGAFYRIGTGIYRCLAANFKAKDKYISEKLPFALGAIDDRGSHRWLYFKTEQDAKAFIKKYYSNLSTNSASYYVDNPHVIKARAISTLARIDNEADIKVYCPENYASENIKNTHIKISKETISKTPSPTLTKDELNEEASKIASKISKRYSELTGFKCVGGYFGIDKKNTISIRFEQYLDYGITVLNYKSGYKIKRVPRLIDITNEFIEDFVVNTMVPSLIANLQRCFFAAHSYMKPYALYDAAKCTAGSKEFFTNPKYAIDEALHTSQYVDEVVAIDFIKECLKDGKLKDERYKYLKTDNQIIAESLKEKYPKVTNNDIELFQIAWNKWNERVGGGLTSAEDFWQDVQYLFRDNPKIAEILKKLEKGL